MLEAESLRLAIDEPVKIVPYDLAWPRLFDQEKRRLEVICPGEFPGIEHIGSTAVSMLSAKPVIDIMAGVHSLAQADGVLPILCANGYTTSAEFNATLADRRWLMRHSEGRRTHHLHLVIFEGSEWRRRVMFRNVLRRSSEIRCRYEKLKFELAKSFILDRETYSAMKTDFVNETLRGVV